MKKFLIFAVAVQMLSACFMGNEAKEEAMQKERDSLQRIINEKDLELNDIMGTINVVQEGISRINEAEGQAQEILLVAEAQAAGISKVAEAINGAGGMESVNMQLAQQYLTQFGNLAKTNNTMIIPSNLADVAGVLKACTSVIRKVEG